jgi:hypothetical protein
MRVGAARIAGGILGTVLADEYGGIPTSRDVDTRSRGAAAPTAP